jgi:hypothetical protein
MRLLALDLSTSCSGWALFIDGTLDSWGAIQEPKYTGKSKDRYPQRSAKVGSMMALELNDLVLHKAPDRIVIEEVCPGGIAGVKSIKSLIQIHGIFLHLLIQSAYVNFNMIQMIQPSSWRKVVGLKKGNDWKESSIKLTNKIFMLELKSSEDDASDAILLGHAYMNGAE